MNCLKIFMRRNDKEEKINLLLRHDLKLHKLQYFTFFYIKAVCKFHSFNCPSYPCRNSTENSQILRLLVLYELKKVIQNSNLIAVIRKARTLYKN